MRKKRLLFLLISLFFFFSLLIMQFYRLQIMEGDQWTEVARRQHFFVVKEPFTRGTIYSKTGRPLALDLETAHLFVDPDSIPADRKKEVILNLLEILPLTPQEYASFALQFYMKSRSRKLMLNLDPLKKEEILSWWRPFAKKNKIAVNAIFFISDYRRSHPYGKLLGQVLHTVQNSRDEVTKEATPTGGLEFTLNRHLKGSQGKRRMKRSPRNRFETGEVIDLPKNGNDVHLTIDHVLQAIAEEEIEKGVKICQAKSGWAVMMDPFTGEIMAIAQYPFFYPDDYKSYYNDKEKVEDTKLRAITDAYEPASVMKPFTIAAALLADSFDPEEKIATSDGKFPGRSRPIHDVGHYQYLNMWMGLQRSSNIYMGRIIQRVIEEKGNQWYRDVLTERFGFGKKTGIELPGESLGLVPTPGKMHPNGALEWSKPTPFSLAMGHNIQVNSLQLIRAIAVIANGGYMVTPTLLKGKSENRVRVLPEEVADTVRHAMKYITKKGGSGTRAALPGYTNAGKTGTSNKIENGQYTNMKTVASFVGIAPADRPAFVLSITMDEPAYRYIPGIGKNHNAGLSAAPVFSAIATRALEYLGIPKDDPNDEDVKEELNRLNQLYNDWNM
ncbi:MAG: penicillin-binding protein 2 [Waddliaceae bacterium]